MPLRLLSFFRASIGSYTRCGMTPRIANAFLVVLLISTILLARPTFAQDTQPVHIFQECNQAEEAGLRDELNGIAQAVFAEEQSGLDLTAIVEDNWDVAGMDSAVDSAVRAAIGTVSSRTNWWQRVQSNWSAAWAKWLATRVAAAAFGSQRFRDSFDQLSKGIADDLDREIRAMAAKSASSALKCLEEFIGESFSQTMAQVLENQILAKVDVTEGDLVVEDREFVDLLESHPELMAGVSLIIGAQVSKQLAQKMAGTIIGQVATRVLGKMATSAIPLVGWVIGGVLIIVDVVNAGEGALPQIRKSLRGAKAKATIRKKITIEVRGVLEEELPRLGRSITDDVFSLWLSFRSRHKRVLELAEANPRFRSILDYSTVDDVEKLAELVAVADAILEPEKIDEIIRTGQFERLFSLPVEAYEILSVGEVGDEVRDPVELVLAWAELAGEEGEDIIVGVVTTALHQLAFPSDFGGRETLERVLALEEPIIIEMLMRLGDAERDALIRLSTAQTKWALTVLTAEDILWLAAYLMELPTQAQGGLVDYVRRERGLLSHLQESEELRAKLPAVLSFATTNARFQTILDNTTAEQAPKLTELVASAMEALEPSQLNEMIDTGQFERILALPQQAFVILRENRDPASVTAWADLAGDAIVQVMEIDLYRVATPAEFRDRDELERVLTLQDTEAAQILMRLKQGERDALLELPAELTRSALLELPQQDHSWLASYLQDQSPAASAALVERILHEPELMDELRSPSNSEPLTEDQATREPVPTATTSKNGPSLLLYFLLILAGLIIIFWVGRRIFARNRIQDEDTAADLPERRDQNRDRP